MERKEKILEDQLHPHLYIVENIDFAVPWLSMVSFSKISTRLLGLRSLPFRSRLSRPRILSLPGCWLLLIHLELTGPRPTNCDREVESQMQMAFWFSGERHLLHLPHLWYGAEEYLIKR